MQARCGYEMSPCVSWVPLALELYSRAFIFNCSQWIWLLVLQRKAAVGGTVCTIII